MTVMHTQQNSKENLPFSLNTETAHEHPINISAIKNFPTASTLLPNRTIAHDPQAGLNPIVDAASYLFSVLGKLKHLSSYKQINKLQSELIQEINTFQETIKTLGYNLEFIIVCRYVICALFDDVLSNTSWGMAGQWESYSLLAAFSQDIHHEDKFFSILERAVKDPMQYIDLMELMYICLSMGYKGQYRLTEHNQFQLEQITNSLYKHIRAYRGSFSQGLSPTYTKNQKRSPKKEKSTHSSPIFFIFLVTACIIMAIFVSLGYLMDVISNEAYQNLAQISESVTKQAAN